MSYYKINTIVSAHTDKGAHTLRMHVGGFDVFMVSHIALAEMISTPRMCFVGKSVFHANASVLYYTCMYSIVELTT